MFFSHFSNELRGYVTENKHTTRACNIQMLELHCNDFSGVIPSKRNTAALKECSVVFHKWFVAQVRLITKHKSISGSTVLIRVVQLLKGIRQRQVTRVKLQGFLKPANPSMYKKDYVM